MADKSINLHDVIQIINVKSIADDELIIGTGKRKTPVRTFTIVQEDDGQIIKTEIVLFGKYGKDRVDMIVWWGWLAHYNVMW